MNYYEILDVTRGADKTALKRAYFAAVKRHTPDFDPEGFKMARIAFETLSDDKKRAKYDELLVDDSTLQSDLLYANELMRQNKTKQAVDFLTPAVERHNGADEIALLLAEANFRMGKSGIAARICADIIEKNPQNSKAPLLSARISVERGHLNKAYHTLNSAITNCHNDPHVWISYMNFIYDHYNEHLLPMIGKKAMAVSPDILRDDSILYFLCAVESRDANDDAKDTATFLSKFAELYATDSNRSNHYEEVLDELPFFNQILFMPSVERIYSTINSDKSAKEDYGKMLCFMRQLIAKVKLDADKRIHDVLSDMTVYLLSSSMRDKKEQLFMECFIVNEMHELRRPIKALRDFYPEYFKLNSQFYSDVINVKKEYSLYEKYYNITKRLAKKSDDLLEAGEEEEEEDYDDDENDVNNVNNSDKGNHDKGNNDKGKDSKGKDKSEHVGKHGSGRLGNGKQGSGELDNCELDSGWLDSGGLDSGELDSGDDDDDDEPQKPYVRETPKVGRNDPCTCGSGKKYKACCGRS